MRSEQMSMRLQLAFLYSMAGAALGFIGAAFVWEYIYSIGSRVVSDELYIELGETVRGWGTAAGACSGFIVRVVHNPRPLISLALVNILAVVWGVIGGNYGWHNGLAGFFGAHTLAILGGAVWAMTWAGSLAFRRATTST